MLKSKDIAILLKIHLNTDDWTYEQMSGELYIGTGELYRCLKRCQKGRLYKKESRQVVLEPLYEIIVHAVKYIYPASVGNFTRGIPTAHSASPLKENLMSEKEDQYVWEHPEGEHRGMSVSPFYPKIEACREDPLFYKSLILVDGLRIGRARELKMSKIELKKLLFPQ
ncbi:MAG: hypothetical protein ACLFN5_02465 [bacterium]